MNANRLYTVVIAGQNSYKCFWIEVLKFTVVFLDTVRYENCLLSKSQVSFRIRYACEEIVASTVQYVSFGGTSQVHTSITPCKPD